jgi:hypothetical protein
MRSGGTDHQVDAAHEPREREVEPGPKRMFMEMAMKRPRLRDLARICVS